MSQIIDVVAKWDLRFLKLAKEISEWSKDNTKIGAVIVDSNRRLISQGYNGLPRGIDDTNPKFFTNREWKLQRVVHAEHNAIYNAALNGASLKNTTLYVYGLPVCNECAKGIIQVGIKRVVNQFDDKKDIGRWKSSIDVAMEMFNQVYIDYEFYDLEGKLNNE